MHQSHFCPEGVAENEYLDFCAHPPSNLYFQNTLYNEFYFSATNILLLERHSSAYLLKKMQPLCYTLLYTLSIIDDSY